MSAREEFGVPGDLGPVEAAMNSLPAKLRATGHVEVDRLSAALFRLTSGNDRPGTARRVLDLLTVALDAEGAAELARLCVETFPAAPRAGSRGVRGGERQGRGGRRRVTALCCRPPHATPALSSSTVPLLLIPASRDTDPLGLTVSTWGGGRFAGGHHVLRSTLKSPIQHQKRGGAGKRLKAQPALTSSAAVLGSIPEPCADRVITGWPGPNNRETQHGKRDR